MNKISSGEGEQGEALECWRHLAVEAAREWQRCRGKPLWRIILEAITESHVVRETVGTNTVTAPSSTVAGAQEKTSRKEGEPCEKNTALAEMSGNAALTFNPEGAAPLEKKEASSDNVEATRQKE